MKKFMIAVLALVALSGCASNNARYQMAGDVGATVAGAIVGNYVDRKMGGKGTIGGVVGAIVARQVFAGSQVSGAADSQTWWPCKAGYGQVREKQTNGTFIAACKEGYPQVSRPVQQVAEQQSGYNGYSDSGASAAYYEGLSHAQRRREYANARAWRARGCIDGGGC